MKKPNIFIIGAPKCGTTSLSHWLAQHPAVYFAPGKETRFFDTDHNWDVRLTRAEYEALFKGATDDHLAVAEGSPTYLKSDAAVPNILKYSPDAKFIVCVRNPVHMAVSLHNQLVCNGEENLLNFEHAWRAQASRAAGLGVRTSEPTRLLYGLTCKVGEQIEKLLTRVSREKVHVVFIEDMKNDPRAVYNDVLRFLGLPEQQIEFQALNQSSRRRSLPLRQVSRRVARLKRAMGANKSFGILRWLDQWNRKPSKLSVEPHMIDELRNYFKEDVQLLSSITGRQLDWLSDDLTALDQLSNPSAVINN